MLWRTYLLNKLIGPRDIIFLVGRHPIVYVKVLIQYAALLLLVYLVRGVVGLRLPVGMDRLIFGCVVALIYLVGVFMILRWYFDIMVLTEEHLYIVFWDSFFRYRLKIIARSSVLDITVSPTGALGAVLKDSTINIATEQDEIITFAHVYHADKVVKKMYEVREDYKQKSQIVEVVHTSPEASVDDEKFKVLVETLGEVIVDYMKKKED